MITIKFPYPESCNITMFIDVLSSELTLSDAANYRLTLKNETLAPYIDPISISILDTYTLDALDRFVLGDSDIGG